MPTIRLIFLDGKLYVTGTRRVTVPFRQIRENEVSMKWQAAIGSAFASVCAYTNFELQRLPLKIKGMLLLKLGEWPPMPPSYTDYERGSEELARLRAFTPARR